MFQTPVAGMLKSVVCIFSAMTCLYASAHTFTAMISSKFCMHKALWCLQFMNPKLMVKKDGKCPPGDINTWFFEGNGLKDHVHKKLPSTTASKMQVGKPNFGHYPENLLISRRRFSKAFQVLLLRNSNVHMMTWQRLWSWSCALNTSHALSLQLWNAAQTVVYDGYAW